MATLDLVLDNGTRDGHTNTTDTGGSYALDITDDTARLGGVNNTEDYRPYFAFTDAVPAGAVIDSATLRLICDDNADTSVGTSRSFNCFILDFDNVAAFSEATPFPNGTDAHVAADAFNTTLPVIGSATDGALVQVTGWGTAFSNWRARPGWAANNHFGIYINKQSSSSVRYYFKSQDHADTSDRPKLRVVYHFAAPTEQATDMGRTGVGTPTTSTITWTRGNGSKVAVFIKAGANQGFPSPVNETTYTANGAFGSGTQVGSSGWYCVYNGTGTSVAVTNLTAATSYTTAAVEYNGGAGEETYNTNTATNNPGGFITLATEPNTQATDIVVLPSAEAADISWTRGNGDGVAVFVKLGDSGSATPVDGTIYTASSVFGAGTQIGSTGWFCVYQGMGTSVTISGLSGGLTYRVQVFERGGSGALANYFTDTATGNPVNFETVPAIQAHSITVETTEVSPEEFEAEITWVRGSGDFVAVFMGQYDRGLAVPVNGETYTGDAQWSVGDPPIDGSEGPWYPVYVGTGTTVTVTGFSGGTGYRVHALEFIGEPGSEIYLQGGAADNPVNFTAEFGQAQQPRFRIERHGMRRKARPRRR